MWRPVGAIRIGAASGCDLVLTDRSVSRHHVEIGLEAGGYRIRDLGSTNGTWFAGARALDGFLTPGALAQHFGVVDLADVQVPAAGRRPGLGDTAVLDEFLRRAREDQQQGVPVRGLGIAREAQLADQVIVAIATNGAKQPLFTVEERLAMLREAVGGFPRVSIQAFDGLLAEFAKRVGASVIVRGWRAVSGSRRRMPSPPSSGSSIGWRRRRGALARHRATSSRRAWSDRPPLPAGRSSLPSPSLSRRCC